MDRAIANPSWQDLFPRAKVIVKNGPLSDHGMLILHCKKEEQVMKVERPFWFEAMWLRHPKLVAEIEKLWKEEGLTNNCSVRQKIQHLQTRLKEWFEMCLATSLTEKIILILGCNKPHQQRLRLRAFKQ